MTDRADLVVRHAEVEVVGGAARVEVEYQDGRVEVRVIPERAAGPLVTAIKEVFNGLALREV